MKSCQPVPLIPWLVVTLVPFVVVGCSDRQERKSKGPAASQAANASSTAPALPGPLPELGDLDSFNRDQSPAREICRRIGVPELPDLTGLDDGGKKHFYDMFNRLRLRPGDAAEIGLLGQLYDAQKFTGLADRTYRRAIELDPDDYRWHYMLAVRREADGDTAAALLHFKRAGELKPDYAPVWVRLAWCMTEHDPPDTGAALAFLARYISLRPNDPLGYVERAQIHADEDRWEQAKENLDRAVSLGSPGKKGHRLLGAYYGRLGKSEDNRFHLAMSAAIRFRDEMDDPVALTVRRLETCREAALTRLNGLLESARYRDAVEMADEVLAVSKEGRARGVACGRIAEAYRQLGDYANAARYALEARQSLPDKGEPRASLALIYLHTGRFEAALMEANDALDAEPDLGVALYARGLALIQLAIAEKALPESPGRITPKDRLALAIHDLEATVHQEPVNLSYLVALGTAYGLAGDYDRADQTLATALRISPDDANTLALKAKAEKRESFWQPLETHDNRTESSR